MFGGFSLKIFESKPSEKFECPLCLETLKDPLQCSNGHLFCKICILSVLERNNRCPVCNTCISIELLSKSLFVQQCIENLTTVCASRDCEINFVEGFPPLKPCSWKGPLHARSHHYETECGYFVITCENAGCEVQLLRMDSLEHNSLCLFGHVNCEHCNELLQRGYVTHHSESCKHRPVLCPKNCSAILSFKEVEAHLQSDCPNQKAAQSNIDLSALSLIDHDQVKVSAESVSKSSKKNAKKAARRQKVQLQDSPAVTISSQSEVEIKVTMLRTLFSQLTECLPLQLSMCSNVGAARTVADLKLNESFIGIQTEFLSIVASIVPDTSEDLQRAHFSAFLVFDAKSIGRWVLKETYNEVNDKQKAMDMWKAAILWTVDFMWSYTEIFGYTFLSWLTLTAEELPEFAVVYRKLLQNPPPLLVALEKRRAIQRNTEVIVSGAEIDNVNGKYRFNANHDVYEQVTGLLVQTRTYFTIFNSNRLIDGVDIWLVMAHLVDGSNPEVLYEQVADNCEEIAPSETKQWICHKNASNSFTSLMVKMNSITHF